MNFPPFLPGHYFSKSLRAPRPCESLSYITIQGRQDQVYAHHINTQSSELPFLFRIRHIESKILKFPSALQDFVNLCTCFWMTSQPWLHVGITWEALQTMARSILAGKSGIQPPPEHQPPTCSSLLTGKELSLQKNWVPTKINYLV